jgi:hypothetical protein
MDAKSRRNERGYDLEKLWIEHPELTRFYICGLPSQCSGHRWQLVENQQSDSRIKLPVSTRLYILSIRECALKSPVYCCESDGSKIIRGHEALARRGLRVGPSRSTVFMVDQPPVLVDVSVLAVVQLLPIQRIQLCPVNASGTKQGAALDSVNWMAPVLRRRI